MRDIDLLPRTMRTIRDKGAASRPGNIPAPPSLKAGDAVLNLQAIHDLIADGWLSANTDTRNVKIAAWPRFADQNTS